MRGKITTRAFMSAARGRRTATSEKQNAAADSRLVRREVDSAADRYRSATTGVDAQ